MKSDDYYIVVLLFVVFLIPFIDEFETFNCVITYDVPKITIA